MTDEPPAEPHPAWTRQSDEREEGLPRVGPYPIAGLLRRARREADLSQRELAKRAGLAPSTVGRIETGTVTPTIAVFERLLSCTGHRLVVVDEDGHVLLPMRDVDDIRDLADRRYPAHLDTILDPRIGEWWGDLYGLARPPETFYRDRERRDALRRLSRWTVRVKQLRDEWPPPDPAVADYLAKIRAMGPRDSPIPEGGYEVDEWDGDQSPDSMPPPPPDLYGG